MRLLAAVLVCFVLPAATAGPAYADDASRAVLVIDRGADAKLGGASDAGNALRIWKTLEANGVDTTLLAAGVGANGETSIKAVQPTRAALAALDDDPVFAFRGPTDARAALAHVLDAGGKGAVDVILLGPWSEVAVEKAATFRSTLKRWDARAPEGTRIFSIGKGTGRAAVAAARGWVGDGRVVIGFDKPAVTTTGFSPLPGAEGTTTPLKASIRVLGDVLWMGAPPKETATRGTPVLSVSSDVAEDRFESKVLSGLHTWTLLRRVVDGRTATVTFRPTEDAKIHWFVRPPEPLTFRWEQLLADARLLGSKGEAAPVFAAIDAVAGKPISTAFRLLRTRSGRTPAWRVGAEQGALPPGLTVDIGDEVQTSPEIVEAEVRVRFEAARGRPLSAQGVITLTADGMPETLRMPYEVRVQPGRLTLEAEGHPVALPTASKDPRTRLLLVAANPNTPASVPLRASCDGGQERYLQARVHVPGRGVVTWALTEPFPLATGAPHELEFVLAGDPPEDVTWPCKLTLALDAVEGVEITGAEPTTVRVRRRRPRLVLEQPLPEHRLLGATLMVEEPPVLTLDADGGDGDWLVGLLESQPVVRVGSEAPIGWQAVPRGPGVWHLVPAGRWTGPEPGIFEDETLSIDVSFEWPAGDVPPPTQVPVRVPARWGKRGFLLVGLAGLALILALTVMGWMRTPAVKGTLLYTVDGLDGTVGRLDLLPVKRGTKPVTSDPKGRLAVAGDGDVVAKVRATRVGGMLEYTDAEGGRERRLLVDGMSLRLGRHLVRYVSGRAQDADASRAPTEVPDLLGPEYDLESGRIDGMGEADDKR